MGCVVNTTPRPFTQGKESRYPLYRRLGGPQGRSGRVQKISLSAGFDPRTVQNIVSRYTNWAIPAHLWRTKEFFGEGVGQRERESGGCSPLVKGSTQFANEWNPYSDYVVTDVFSTELGIRLSFIKTSHPSVRHCAPPQFNKPCLNMYDARRNTWNV
jgi:hypothetical protein